MPRCEAAKKFFAERGVAVAGGITYTVSEPNRFETFSYSNPEHRRAVQQIAEHTARHFDEFILDDFFFTSTKSEFDVKARGTRSWTEYRLAVMEDAARNLVIGPAKRVNPKVKVVIKYPNWYDHFPALGFNLARGPQLFDGIYTGTETRDAVRSAQHLQPYLGYNIMRYFAEHRARAQRRRLGGYRRRHLLRPLRRAALDDAVRARRARDHAVRHPPDALSAGCEEELAAADDADQLQFRQGDRAAQGSPTEPRSRPRTTRAWPACPSRPWMGC